MDRKKVLENMEQKEYEGDFSAHVCPINYKMMKKVTPEYDYLRRGFFNQLGSFFARPILDLAGFIFGISCKLTIVGKENLKGLKKGIITSNHINNIDCALIKKPLFGKRVYYTVGEFNNFKGIAGSALRAAGTLPFSDNTVCMRHLTNAIDTLAKKDNFIVFYTEGSLWWCYEKPRPLQDGAFFYAAKYNLPIIPMFFTFKNLKQRKDGSYKKKFYLHIMPPIYPDPNNSLKQNMKYLKLENSNLLTQKYESFYNKKLEYTTKKQTLDN